MKQRPRFIKQDQVALARLQTSGVVCIEKFTDFPQMGRFTLRDEGKNLLTIDTFSYTKVQRENEEQLPKSFYRMLINEQYYRNKLLCCI